ncbi:MAG TPA: shikimate dehydrogenase [Gemmatimonadaceae bacterium]|nr:shikimate dehydrogenase [Gemmatimonadaceae bacterium]
MVLLGQPVAHSLSPRFQSAALRAAGLNVVYEARDVGPSLLAAVFGELVAEGAAGNVTVPHKETAGRLCDHLTPVAERVGAVNTFWVDGKTLVGDNTDVGGFAAACNSPVAPGGRVALFGAGGAAAAVLAAIAEWPGVEVRIWNRGAERARMLAGRFGAKAVATADEALDRSSLVVNATSIGLDGLSQPVDVARLPQGADVIDLVYGPNETAWVRAARAAGHRAMDGLAMLIEQGALAFERWFGMAPDRDAMWRAAAPDRNRFTGIK